MPDPYRGRGEPRYASEKVRDPHVPLDVLYGTVEDVMAWVAGDPVRARMVLYAELDRPRPRKTLVSQLEGVG